LFIIGNATIINKAATAKNKKTNCLNPKFTDSTLALS